MEKALCVGYNCARQANSHKRRNERMSMILSNQERWILQYLDEHCDAPDRSGFITIQRFWSRSEEANEGHARAIADGIAITSDALEAMVSRLEQHGLVGKSRTSESLLVWITASGQDSVREPGRDTSDDIRRESAVTIKLFISHSSKDVPIADRLIDLLRAALNLPADAIRCTSVSGFKLPVGADTDDHLRREIQESRSFIGLITELSFESAYVLFELGARWGAGKPMAPLLAAGTSPSVLRGPIGGKNALSCDSRGDLHQLIDDIGVELGRQPAKPASYNDKVERLVEVSQELRNDRTPPPSDETAEEPEDHSSDELNSDEVRYLMSLSRPRNRNHVPIGYFDTNPNPKEENFRVMMERFVQLRLMRHGAKTYVFTERGYERADMFWRGYILKAIAALQAKSSAYVEASEIAKAVSLTNGEDEAEEVDRHLRALERAGLVECAEDTTSLSALLTSEGRGELRKFSEIDFRMID